MDEVGQNARQSQSIASLKNEVSLENVESQKNQIKIPHIPVLLEQVLSVFDTPLIQKGGILIDCTLGFGGHSKALLEKFKNLKIIGIDQDIQAREFAKNRLSGFKDRFEIRAGRYSSVVSEILDSSLSGKIVGILADIGVSSLQFDKKERGFCFDSPFLDMRMDKDGILSAKEVINTWSVGELERIFREFGEIREYKKLAKIIGEERKRAEITSARELSGLISKHLKSAKIHPATLAFQAIRIAVNDELGELERLLECVGKCARARCLKSGARVGIISFHSLEDRKVKNAFREWERECVCDSSVFKCNCGGKNALGKCVNKKPLVASKAEIAANARARSAKLRVFEIGN